MPIMAPSDLPILRVDSDPMKKYCLSKLGYPSVQCEFSDDQWESVLRTAGAFIAHYFSKEQMFATFYTNPLQSTYDLPEGAYWIQEVEWDPVTTNIDQIFGAESFLFCYSGGSILLTDKGAMPFEHVYEKRDKVKVATPFGMRKPKMRWNTRSQPVSILRTPNDYLVCTPNHPIICDGKMIPAEKCKLGQHLLNHKDKQCEIISTGSGRTEGTWSIKTPCGSVYVSALGNEFYLAH